MKLPHRVQRKYRERIKTFSTKRLEELKTKYQAKIEEIKISYPYFRKKRYKDYLPPLDILAEYEECCTYLSLIKEELWKRNNEWELQNKEETANC